MDTFFLNQVNILCVYVNVSLCAFVYLYLFMFVSLCIRLVVCVYVCVCVCVFVCKFVCVCRVISLLNMLTPGMMPVCAFVLCPSFCLSVTAFYSRTIGPISMKLHTSNLL